MEQLLAPSNNKTVNKTLNSLTISYEYTLLETSVQSRYRSTESAESTEIEIRSSALVVARCKRSYESMSKAARDNKHVSRGD